MTMPSPEFLAISALRQPARSGPGDMWLCRRLGIVRVFNAYKRGSRRGQVHGGFYLYHWGEPSLRLTPANWRDDDPNSYASDPALSSDGEKWEYVGNLFELLPFSAIAGAAGPRVREFPR